MTSVWEKLVPLTPRAAPPPPKKPPPIPADPAGDGMRALNTAYGWGFLVGLTGDKSEDRWHKGLSRPAFDQFIAGVKDGRRAWSAMEPV